MGSYSTDFDPPAVHFHRLFQALYLRRRAVRVATENTSQRHLSALESHIIHDILSGEALTAAELGTRLGVEKSSLSREIRGLIERKLLKESVDPTDSRRKLLAVLPLGSKYYQEMAETEIRVLDRIYPHPRDSASLAKLLSSIADSFGASSWKKLPFENALFGAVARIARLSGIFGSTLWESELGPGEYHYLALLEEFHGEGSAREILSLLHLNAGVLARTTKKLSSLGYLRVVDDPLDGRANGLELLPNGRAVLASLNRRVETILSHSEELLVRANELLLSYLASKLPRSDSYGIFTSISEHSSVVDRTRLRTFFLEQLAASGRLAECPESLFTKEDRCLSLAIGGEMRAVAAISRAGFTAVGKRARDERIIRAFAEQK